jgi:hypothetical protein
MNISRRPSGPGGDSELSADPVDFAALLRQELPEIQKLRKNRLWDKGDRSTPSRGASASHIQTPDPPLSGSPSDQVFAAAHREELVGLAFSGGGIRSATFNLGVLQGLALCGLLPMFDYLSTVSGGGYIGGWLESWIYRAGIDPEVARCTGQSEPAQPSPIHRVQECLKPIRSNKVEHGEASTIRFLREYSNYLTPRLGFLGADTWAAIAIYLRNLFLNQAILILFLSFVLLLPYLALCLTRFLTGLKCLGPYHLAPIVTFALVLVALCGVGRNMNHLTGDDSTGEFPPSARQGSVLAYIAAPLLLAGWCLSVWLSQLHAWDYQKWWVWPAGGIVGFAIPWSLGAIWGISVPVNKEQFWKARSTRVKSIAFSMITGPVAGLLVEVLATKVLKRWACTDHGLWHTVSFGAPLVIIAFLLAVALQLGLMGRLSPDPRGEWWGRFGGWLLILSIAWAAIFAIAFYAPLGVVWSGRLLSYSSLVWVISTLTGVLGGKSGKTGSLGSKSWKDAALSITPYIFIIGLAAALATAIEVTLAAMQPTAALAQFWSGSHAAQKTAGWIVSLNSDLALWATAHTQGTIIPAPAQSGLNTGYVAAHWQILSAACDEKLLLFVAIVAVLCLYLSWRVDLNQFSMNYFYRNRLVRCYLGASHKMRRPNPFTGFDPEDDLNLSRLQASGNYSGPFPIVNTALNLVKGQNLAWQERKAESFVITPLRCGFDTWLERLDLDIESAKMRRHGVQEYGYRPASDYAYRGGLRIGAAMSISGAAASPNMGYHSVPSLAFLMTFFNVRLGFWSGNPRHDATWKMPGPRFGLLQLLAELFGLTDDEAKYVYLSDGGHFENLGLYELIKRRCKYIVVCDADCDSSYAFGDLGNAIRKCREDIGVEITIVTKDMTPANSPQKPDGTSGSDSTPSSSAAAFSKYHWAKGTIDYSSLDPGAEPGVLIYLKTSLTGDEPIDVLSYHKQSTDFPHQTTADQWFTESQFESYRRLGQHVVEHMFDQVDLTKRETSHIFAELAKGPKEA